MKCAKFTYRDDKVVLDQGGKADGKIRIISSQRRPRKVSFILLQGVIDIQGIISVSHIYIILVNMNNNKYNVYKNVGSLRLIRLLGIK